jgi:hypothetical protein
LGPSTLIISLQTKIDVLQCSILSSIVKYFISYFFKGTNKI